MMVADRLFIAYALLLQFVTGLEKCEKIIDYSLMSNSQHLTTRILLRDECVDSGVIQWRYSPLELHQIVQFRKTGHQSFTVCLSFPDDDESNRFSVHQLRGVSKKLIRSLSNEENVFGPVCVESQCSHISLMLQRDPAVQQQQQNQPSPATTSVTATNGNSDSQRGAVKISYQFATDQRCSRCSDQCMKTVFCNSDYMFIGTVISSVATSEDERSYRSIIKLERFLRHNNTFDHHSGINTHPSCRHGNHTSSSSVGQQVKHPVQMSGEISVHSNCHLRLMKKYFISANFRVGLRNKGKLTVSCAQEDVDYSLFVLQKLMMGPQCC